jgi:DNA-binding NtrC family response regulator
MELQQIKQRFGIIGNSPALNRAIDVAVKVAPTDINVLVTGESGTGKENIPKIIHQLSKRKHNTYIAVNCGAIPDGTIDSELFGHEKGAFTGAHDKRKGYFEVADGGTIFLDEVAELPLSTQVRLLRVLETGEFLRVGSSQPIKTNVRVVAATNENLQESIIHGKFREDLYYRLSSVPIKLPPLRERKDDIYLLFRKFAQEFSEKYRMPPIRLTDGAINLLKAYHWPGNIRQLKNVTEQISIIETDRLIEKDHLQLYLPDYHPVSLPMLHQSNAINNGFDKDFVYKALFDMKKEIDDLKKALLAVISKTNIDVTETAESINFQSVYSDNQLSTSNNEMIISDRNSNINTIEVEESLSIVEKEKELIEKALKKHRGRRKNAAKELGISERTLYRKIKEYELED